MSLRWEDLWHLVWIRKKKFISSEVFQVLCYWHRNSSMGMCFQFPGNEQLGFSAGATSSASGIQKWLNIVSLAMTPVNPKQLSFCPQASLSKDLLSHKAKSTELQAWRLPQEIWGRFRHFASNTGRLPPFILQKLDPFISLGFPLTEDIQW